MKIISVYSQGERLVSESVDKDIGKEIVGFLRKEYKLKQFMLVGDDYIMNERNDDSKYDYQKAFEEGYAKATQEIILKQRIDVIEKNVKTVLERLKYGL